jgi:hypothetical protein
MLPPARDESCSGGPTPEMLAGVYLEVEAEEDLTIRPCQLPETFPESIPNGMERPSTDQLAGLYLHVEAPEDLTVHPGHLPETSK